MPRVPGLSACNVQGAPSVTLIPKKTEKNLALGRCVSRGAVPRAATMRLPGLNVNLKLATSSTHLASTLTLVAHLGVLYTTYKRTHPNSRRRKKQGYREANFKGWWTH